MRKGERKKKMNEYFLRLEGGIDWKNVIMKQMDWGEQLWFGSNGEFKIYTLGSKEWWECVEKEQELRHNIT